MLSQHLLQFRFLLPLPGPQAWPGSPNFFGQNKWQNTIPTIPMEFCIFFRWALNMLKHFETSVSHPVLKDVANAQAHGKNTNEYLYKCIAFDMYLQNVTRCFHSQFEVWTGLAATLAPSWTWLYFRLKDVGSSWSLGRPAAAWHPTDLPTPTSSLPWQWPKLPGFDPRGRRVSRPGRPQLSRGGATFPKLQNQHLWQLVWKGLQFGRGGGLGSEMSRHCILTR